MVLRESFKKNIWIIALIAGVVSVPLFTDYVIEGSSLAATLGQIETVGQGLGKIFPVRIDSLNVSGQGNLFYLLPALLHLAGMGLGGAYKWTLLLLNFATAAIAFYCFERCGGRREIGVIGCILYTWCPYRCSEMYLVGDLGTIAAWTFLPILVLGLKFVYTQDREQENYGRCWVVLTWGFTLLLASSPTFFTVGVVLVVLTLFAMGKETFRRETMVVLGKTVIAVLLLNAGALVPMLLCLRDASVVGAMLVRDMRKMGMFLTQYLTVFSWGGDGIRMTEEGMNNVQAMGPGIAAILLVFVYLGAVFTGRLCKPERVATERQDKSWHFAGRMMCVSAVVVLMSTNLFPWDIFENRNLLFSILLALIHTPAKLGAVADISLIFVGCLLLQRLSEYREAKEYWLLLLATGAVSFGTTQFMLGNILITRQFVRQEIEALGTTQTFLLAQEPIVWRIMEGISIAALCGCVIMWIVRRRNSDKRV